MTELEIMHHAKDYLDKLAQGIDPLTGQKVPENDVLNNVRISRCLSYVSDVLRQVIENGGISVRKVKRSEETPFTLSFEERACYSFPSLPVTASVIAKQLNELVESETMRKLKTTSITKFLLQAGLLFEKEGADGSRNKRPTEAGRMLGISTTVRTGQNGEYTAVVYSREAQQFILDNLDAVAEINAVPLHENEGKSWKPEEDDYLRQAFRAGTEVKVMSDKLKRTREAIRVRLKKLGLTSE